MEGCIGICFWLPKGAAEGEMWGEKEQVSDLAAKGLPVRAAQYAMGRYLRSSTDINNSMT